MFVRRVIQNQNTQHDKKNQAPPIKTSPMNEVFKIVGQFSAKVI